MVIVTLLKGPHLNICNLQRCSSSMWADNIILGSLFHLSLQGFVLTVNVRKSSPSWSAALHL